MYAQYSFGNFKVGAFDAYRENGVADKAATASADTATAANGDRYDYEGVGVEFAVNDQLSVSYVQEKYKRTDKTQTGALTTYAVSSVETEADYIQAAYNIGGATVGIALVDTSNSDYTEYKEEKKSLFTIGMEF